MLFIFIVSHYVKKIYLAFCMLLFRYSLIIAIEPLMYVINTLYNSLLVKIPISIYVCSAWDMLRLISTCGMQKYFLLI